MLISFRLLDFVSQRIFWTDAKLHLLSSADFDGQNRRTILSSPTVLKHPFSVAVFEVSLKKKNFLYFDKILSTFTTQKLLGRVLNCNFFF